MPNAVQDLIRELLPSPQRCLEEIHALLPQLAAQRYQELVEEVSHGELLGHLVLRRPPSQCTCPSLLESL